MNKPKIEDFDYPFGIAAYAKALEKWGDEKEKESKEWKSISNGHLKLNKALQKQVRQISKLVNMVDEWGDRFSESSMDFIICQIKGGSASLCSGYEKPDEVKEIWKLLNKSE